MENNLKTKILQLKQLGYFEVDERFLRAYIGRKTKDPKIVDKYIYHHISKESIIAINFNGTMYFYSKGYVEKHSVKYFEIRKDTLAREYSHLNQGR